MMPDPVGLNGHLPSAPSERSGETRPPAVPAQTQTPASPASKQPPDELEVLIRAATRSST